MNQERDLLSAVRELVDAHFSGLRRTVRKNIARLTSAFLHLAWSIRFGYGGLHLTYIARGYARVELIKDLKYGQQPFLIRGRRKVIVQTKVRGRQRRLSLGRLPHRLGRPIRYRHVLYHSQKAEPVDVIVYRGKGFQEPWFLIVPPDSEAWLPTEEVLRLYRQRMQ